jgi:hypothetical protein
MNNGIGSGSSGNLNIGLSYMYSYSDKYFDGSSPSNYKYIDNSYFNFTSFKASYNFSNEFSLNSNLGFFINKAQNFDFGANQQFSRNAFGLGDASIGFSYLIFNENENLLNVLPSFNVTLPIGIFDQKDGAVVLPIDIQPSSGSYRYNLGLSMSKYFEDFNLIVISSNFFEYSQRIETVRTHYKYGDLYNLALSGIYIINESTSAGLEFRNQIRTKSEDKDKKIINATGGYVVFLTPSINYNIFNDLSLNAQFELPVYKNMNGIQLTNNFATTINLSYIFNFAEEKSFTPIKMQEGNHHKRHFTVSGNCEMCQERIEGIADEFENVILAEWDSELQLLYISYNLEPDFDKILRAIAKAGHDAENYIADIDSYNALPKCCKYK